MEKPQVPSELLVDMLARLRYSVIKAAEEVSKTSTCLPTLLSSLGFPSTPIYSPTYLPQDTVQREQEAARQYPTYLLTYPPTYLSTTGDIAT